MSLWTARRTVSHRQDTTICPLTTEAERDTATGWVREALRLGQYRWRDGDKDFPSLIWHRDITGQYWCGRCINGILGAYKGWPVEEDECRAVFD